MRARANQSTRQPPQTPQLEKAQAIKETVDEHKALRETKQAIAQSSHAGRPSKLKALKASQIAARTADRLVDKSMPVEEQERRKRAVIKGPQEFRDIREYLPKPKT